MKNFAVALLLFWVSVGSLSAAPEDSHHYAKQIVGAWDVSNGRREYAVTFKGDGTYAVQKDGIGPLVFGDHWRVEGDKLVLNYGQVTDKAKIISFTPSRFETEREVYSRKAH